MRVADLARVAIEIGRFGLHVAARCLGLQRLFNLAAMTNDEVRMTNEIRMTKLERRRVVSSFERPKRYTRRIVRARPFPPAEDRSPGGRRRDCRTAYRAR